jgi:GNAT superfamily N-acetyltransferase
MAQSLPAAFSPVDSARFSVRVARAHHVTASNLPKILDFCTSTNIDLLIARCDGIDLAATHEMESRAFFLMDTLVYYKFELAKGFVTDDSGIASIRTYLPDDKILVQQVAASAFKGYRGHYHADPRLEDDKCDQAYVSWAERLCISRTVLNEVLIAEYANKVVGFAALQVNCPQEAEGVLFGVAVEAQGFGIYGSLLVKAIQWCKDQGVDHMMYSTQLTNIAAQKVLSRLGFEISHSYYTFHKWFTPEHK